MGFFKQMLCDVVVEVVKTAVQTIPSSTWPYEVPVKKDGTKHKGYKINKPTDPKSKPGPKSTK